MKEQSRSEELSKAIDALNNQQSYTTRYEEVAKLLNTAAYIKKYGKSAQNSAIISQLTQRISDDLAARRRRKRMYSAAAGIAAAVFLIINISVQLPTNLLQSESVQPAPQIVAIDQTTSTAENRPLSATAPDNERPKPVSNPAVKAETIQPVKAQQSAPKQKALENSEQAVAKTQPQQEKPLVVAQNRNADSPKVLMVLPDRKADTISEEADVVKLVYAQGTDKEIIITQRPRTESQSIPDSGQAVSVMKAKDASGVNRATRSVNGVEVVVEGKQPQDELEKVAQSLITAEKSDSKQAETSGDTKSAADKKTTSEQR